MYLHHFTENHSSDPNSPIFKKLNKSYKEFKNLQRVKGKEISK